MAENGHTSTERVGLDSSGPTQAARRRRALLAHTAARERASAQVLRARGNEAAAARAELAASRIDLMLAEPQAVRRMHAFVRHLSGASHHHQLLERAAEGALALHGADLATIQLRDPRHGSLRVAAQVGLGGIAAASDICAVHATPLIDTANRVRGVLSTHFRQPHRPRPQDLQIMAWYGELTGAAIAAQQSAPTLLYRDAAKCHEQAAERHDAVASVMRACARSFWTVDAPANAARAQEYAREAEARAIRERQRGRTRRRLIAPER